MATLVEKTMVLANAAHATNQSVKNIVTGLGNSIRKVSARVKCKAEEDQDATQSSENTVRSMLEKLSAAYDKMTQFTFQLGSDESSTQSRYRSSRYVDAISRSRQSANPTSDRDHRRTSSGSPTIRISRRSRQSSSTVGILARTRCGESNDEGRASRCRPTASDESDEGSIELF